MAVLNFLLLSLFLMTGICLELCSAAPTALTASPPETASKIATETEVNANHDDATDDKKQPTAAHSSTGEKSISLGFKQPAGLSKAKRDVEQEADSANGKTPLYLFKKDFYHPNTMRFLTSSFTNGNGKDLYPFYTRSHSGGVKYQRNRRSFQTDPFDLSTLPITTSHASRHPADELDLELDNQKDKEAFFRLMALLASKESNQQQPKYNLLNEDFLLPGVKMDENEGTFQDEEAEDLPLPIDLGYYGSEPGDLFSTNHPTAYEMDGSPTELTRMGIRLNEYPGTHGLYMSPQKKQRQDTDDEWLEDAVPLQNHFKTRRSDNTLFRFNPVKSHFRRYQRSGHSNYNNAADFGIAGGRFGSFYPTIGEQMLIRKRRSFNPTKVAHLTM
ncbi:uncharacterized protein LOC110854319 isoform X1 [Folsomia candida]|uniref:uncharacterized protein LOC110854319 isoform X1 n=1 Tax=Folsomia candida TaxID=158441 RepID=UPI000B9089DD|nr:uncharacterized protein LOC110854319 isoform X1 [Folsomia candida]